MKPDKVYLPRLLQLCPERGSACPYPCRLQAGKRIPAAGFFESDALEIPWLPRCARPRIRREKCHKAARQSGGRHGLSRRPPTTFAFKVLPERKIDFGFATREGSC